MIEMQWLFAYLVLGSAVGFLAGLLGVGGGGVMVPVLTTMFMAQGFPPEHIVHVALGTSMAAIIMTSISSLRAHHAHAAVIWSVVWHISPGILLGAFGATFIASHVSSRPLAIFFACFIAYVFIQMLLNVKPKPTRQLPDFLGFSITGVGIGGVSALVAIGGGTLTVPFLTWCNVKIQKAIGTSAAIGLPIAIAGTTGYLLSGWDVQGMPAYTFGYVYLPAVVLISIVSYTFAPLGAKLAHRLSVGVMKKIFAALLVILCIKMLHTVFA